MAASRAPHRNATAALILAVATAAVYARVGSFAFLPGDDSVYVAENPLVREGVTWRGLRWALTSLEHANWHPLTWVSHMLDAQLFGMAPGAHHLVNVSIHAANAALLLVVLCRLTGAPWRSALAAALFALHPLRVESVAWIAERKDLLAGFFFLLTLGAYVRHARRPGPRRFGWVVVCFALGLLSKPMLVTVPFLLVLLDYWPLGRVSPRLAAPGRFRALGRCLWEKWPLLALSACDAALTLAAQRRGAAVSSLSAAPFANRLGNAVVSLAKYLGKGLWPTELAALYPYPRDGLPAWQIAGAVCLLVTLTALALRELRRRPSFIVGWLWFLGMLVPVIGFVQVGVQAMADRYTYLPLIGVSVALAWWLPGAWLTGHRRGVATCLALTALGTLAAITRAQAEYWRDGITLYRRTIAVTADNALTHWRLGQALVDLGAWDEAVAQMRESVRIAPEPGQALSMGLLLESRGQRERALEFLREAVRILPRFPLGHFTLGLVLARLERYQEAVAHFREAATQDPAFAEAHYQLGLALARAGDLEGAVRSLSETIALRSPFSAEAHYNLGVVLEQLGRREEAEVHYRQGPAGR